MTVTGLLLAGGASRRFPPNKLLARVDGEPLFWRPLRALASASDALVIVAGAGGDALALPELPLAARVVRDREAGHGPLVALDRGLADIRTEWALLAAGDMPDLEPALLRALVARGRDTSADAVALADADRPWPMPALLRARPASAATRRLVESGERRLRAVLDALRVEALSEPWWSAHDPVGAWRRDVDRPADLP